MRTGWCGGTVAHSRHDYEARPGVKRLCPGLTTEQADGMRVCDAPLAHIGHYPVSGYGQGLWCPGRDTDLPGSQDERRAGYGQGLWCPGRDTDLPDAQAERREYLRRQGKRPVAPIQVLGNGDEVTLHGMVLRAGPGWAAIRLDGGEVIVVPAGIPMEVTPRKSPAQRAYEAAPSRMGRVPWGELDDEEQAEWETIALAAQARPDVP